MKNSSSKIRHHISSVFLCGFACAFFFAPALQASDISPEKSAIKILIFGDSIGVGYGVPLKQTWASLLENKLKELSLENGAYSIENSAYSVINASFTGETTKGGLARLPKALQQHQPDLVLLELGGNDGLQGASLALMKQRLNKMVELSQANGAEVILLGMRIPPNYGSRYANAFHSSFKEIAQEKDIYFLSFFLAGVGGNPNYMQSDGIHPNADAQVILLENIWPLLTKVLTKSKASASALATE